MDGNGRRSKQRNQPPSFGHTDGANILNKISQHAKILRIKNLTIYVF